MTFYPPKISERFSSPNNAGRAKFASAVGTSASFVCGSAVRFTVWVEDKRIVEAKFQTNGCGYLMAAADILAQLITGKTLTELHGLENIAKQVEEILGKFPASRRHCLELAVETLHAAFNDFRSTRLEEFAGEKALICTCFGVSEETIEKVISEHHCQTVDEVSHRCNAGNGCGSCQPLIQEIIDSKIFDL